ncbi:hypothetical protein HMI54_005530 [Coelomomyces lativittatus]|nr:hypothetical protein HMI56_005023 [Coelomomyces lativittatus]KAJ1517139.1 hypothetical protein HMI55_000544 [Coelomomyces lativittatus]KAJ1517447.1 hypothetical protein HMI54_005530 [Coelomomyces lativittatus]
MSNQIQYFPPVDEIEILSNEFISPIHAAELIREFAENQPENHELPNMTIYYLKELYSSVVANASLLSKHTIKKSKNNEKEKELT